MNRIPVQPQLLEWAVSRANISPEEIRVRFAKYDQWIDGSMLPTLKQLQTFARVTRTAIGCFFLSEPPEITLPIPDFRTMGAKGVRTPSPDLLDTIFLCQQRQDWYVNYLQSIGTASPLFIGSETIHSNVVHVAANIRETLGLAVANATHAPTWEEALRHLIASAEEAGVLVMTSGVVGSNNTRKLDPKEFRGFVLSHQTAPLIFINGSDTKSAQMFTLAHELAHVWLGQSALVDALFTTVASNAIERWCDSVAAEVLVPLDRFRSEYNETSDVFAEMNRLARLFKVSTLVVLRRMSEIGSFDQARYWALYRTEEQRLLELVANRSGGGDYYITTTTRVSRRFTQAVVTSAFEGRSTFTEAFRLVGCKRMSTFTELGNRVGVPV